MGLSLKELADKIGGELSGDGGVQIDSVAPIETAGTGQISFLANTKYKKFLETTTASAVVLSLDAEFDRLPVIKHKDPYYAFALILDILYPEEPINAGVSAQAHIADSAKIGKSNFVGAFVFIGENSKIGENNNIMPQVHIGRNVIIGNGCKFYPNVSILDGTLIGDNVTIHSGTVIGSDGFGYARHETGIKKVKQIGNVEIANDVEIGSNVSIDRGALGPTKIGNHVKIDNLVQIAHNVVIGDYSIIVAQVGISGSTTLGKGVILAGQVGVVGHIEIGDGVTVGAQSGVSHSIPPGKVYFGSPAREMIRAKRIEACMAKLPDLFRKMNKMEKSLKKDTD